MWLLLDRQVFFVPGSGGKNNLVISMIDVFGEWITFVICVAILWFWVSPRHAECFK